MKRVSLLAVAAVVFCVGVASAQQAPSPMPLPTPPKELQTLRFPAPAAQYDKVAQWYMSFVRTFPARFHISQADSDLILLVLKDCTSRIEGDGVVTAGESKYCERITFAKAHEVLTPYMMQAMGDGNGEQH